MNQTNVVAQMGQDIADALGSTLNNGIYAAQLALEDSGTLSEAQSSLASLLLLFVGIAALFYVGRWLYKAFKRGAA